MLDDDDDLDDPNITNLMTEDEYNMLEKQKEDSTWVDNSNIMTSNTINNRTRYNKIQMTRSKRREHGLIYICDVSNEPILLSEAWYNPIISRKIECRK